MSTYTTEVIKRMLDMKNADLSQTFANIKEKLLIDWKNFYLQQTFQQAFPTFRMMMYKNDNENRNLRKLLEDFTYEDFKAKLDNWLVEGQSQYFVYGNYEVDEAVKLVDEV